MTELVEGSSLANKYRIGRLLGEGGMATVFEGEHVRLGQKVAIKVLHEDLVKDPQLVARFEREGRALSKLKSRHVVRVFDVDETPTGRPFLVMERLEGTDLDRELSARGPLPIAEAIGYLSQACSAMAEAHAAGVVHRDLKPSNLFLTTEGGTRIVKVLDFGIAMDAQPEHAPRLTHTEAVMGTPVYMAPEQFRRTRDVDGRADIWALGATLYEMLTGKPPFSGTASTIGLAVVHDEYPPVEDARPDVPASLTAVIARTLQKDPAKRFATMDELADALLPFGDSVVVAPRSSGRRLPVTPDLDLDRASTRPAVEPVMPAELGVQAKTPAGAALPTLARAKRSPARSLPIGIGLAVVAVAAVLVAMRSPAVTRTTAEPAPPSTPPSTVSPSSSAAPATSTAAVSGSVPASTLGALAPITPPTPSAGGSAAPVASLASPASSAVVVAPRASTAPRSSAPATKPAAKSGTSNAPPLFFPGQ